MKASWPGIPMYKSISGADYPAASSKRNGKDSYLAFNASPIRSQIILPPLASGCQMQTVQAAGENTARRRAVKGRATLENQFEIGAFEIDDVDLFRAVHGFRFGRGIRGFLFNFFDFGGGCERLPAAVGEDGIRAFHFHLVLASREFERADLHGLDEGNRVLLGTGSAKANEQQGGNEECFFHSRYRNLKI